MSIGSRTCICRPRLSDSFRLSLLTGTMKLEPIALAMKMSVACHCLRTRPSQASDVPPDQACACIRNNGLIAGSVQVLARPQGSDRCARAVQVTGRLCASQSDRHVACNSVSLHIRTLPVGANGSFRRGCRTPRSHLTPCCAAGRRQLRSRLPRHPVSPRRGTPQEKLSC